jgi:outer membrane immunogenic protein
MKTSNKLLAGLIGSVSMTSAAIAADLPPPPEVAPVAVVAPAAPVEEPFSGPYIGVLGGFGWFYKYWYWPQWNTETSHVAPGWLAGAEVGFRTRNGNFVFGVEADWMWTNATGVSTCPNAQNFDDTCQTDIHWLATLTGQAGFAPGNVLFYAEAGAAVARESFIANGPTTFTGSILNTGLVVGGGVVVAVGGGLTIKAEYNYIHFGTDAVPFTDGVLDDDFELTQHAHTVKIGLGFQF